MLNTISKSQFKPKALEYLRLVEQRKRSLTITHGGKPVVRIIPYADDQSFSAQSLSGTVVSYTDPTHPVGEKDWEAAV